MIAPDHALPISTQAKLLNISRGTVYYLPKPTSSKDLVLIATLMSCIFSTPPWVLGCYAIN